MNRNEVIAFARAELPWIAKATGYDWDGSLPTFNALSQRELYQKVGYGAFMAYSPQENEVIFPFDAKLDGGDPNCHNPNCTCRRRSGPVWFKSAIIHELVHFLQRLNGGTDRFPGYQALFQSEIEAYSTQARWLWDKRGVEPEAMGLGREDIKMMAHGSCQGAVNAMMSAA